MNVDYYKLFHHSYLTAYNFQRHKTVYFQFFFLLLSQTIPNFYQYTCLLMVYYILHTQRSPWHSCYHRQSDLYNSLYSSPYHILRNHLLYYLIKSGNSNNQFQHHINSATIQSKPFFLLFWLPMLCNSWQYINHT